MFPIPKGIILNINFTDPWEFNRDSTTAKYELL